MELTYEATPTETAAPDVVELALIGKPDGLALFRPNGLDQIIDKIRDEVTRHVPDISTERGRKAIGSLARKVASSKVRLDDLGKELVSEVKAQIGEIDAERKRMRDQLDQLRDDTRRPLTEWEDAEKNRIAAHEDAIHEMLNLVPADTLEAISQQVQRVESFAMRDWQEFKARYGRAAEQAMGRLNDRATAIRVQAEERAELARLQKLEAERLQFEREERIKAQAAAEAKAAAERVAEAERERIEREKDEAEARAQRAEAARVEAIEAAERDRLAEETRQRKEAARAEYERIEAEAARVAAEKRHAEELAAAERKAEADKQAAIEAERRRVAEAKRIEEAAAAKREANKRHRASINRAAVEALVKSFGIRSETAVLVITAIAKGEIPNVSISY